MKIKALERFLKKQRKYQQLVYRGMRRAGIYNKEVKPGSNLAVDAYIVHPIYITFRAIGRSFGRKATTRNYTK